MKIEMFYPDGFKYAAATTSKSDGYRDTDCIVMDHRGILYSINKYFATVVHKSHEPWDAENGMPKRFGVKVQSFSSVPALVTEVDYNQELGEARMGRTVFTVHENVHLPDIDQILPVEVDQRRKVWVGATRLAEGNKHLASALKGKESCWVAARPRNSEKFNQAWLLHPVSHVEVFCVQTNGMEMEGYNRYEYLKNHLNQLVQKEEPLEVAV